MQQREQKLFTKYSSQHLYKTAGYENYAGAKDTVQKQEGRILKLHQKNKLPNEYNSFDMWILPSFP